MNDNNLQQIFSHYTEKFEYVNNPEHNECYKWQVAKEFRMLMDRALSEPVERFAEALNAVNLATKNIVNNFTQPFNGLVKMAQKEPDTVQQMFRDLYSDDEGSLEKQEQLISDFFKKSYELMDKYYPGSYRFKQNSHSVSAYLFLYDPDRHYLFKASHAKEFAECIGCYDDWGTGDLIRLEPFYRMCDQLLEEIKKNKELLATDASRYDGRFPVKPDQMHADKEKHVLVFDIIYCCSTYDLFDGITFKRLSTKEKQLYNERQKKALELLQAYNDAVDRQDKLRDILEHGRVLLKKGTGIKHRKYGAGTVKEIDEEYITVQFDNEEEPARLGLPIVLANKLISSDAEGFNEYLNENVMLLKKEDSIKRGVEYARNALKPYEMYLD